MGGKGKGSYNTPGNKRLRAIIKKYVPEYMATKCQSEKSNILLCIIQEVRDSGRARFIKQSKEHGWFEIPDKEVRDKVGHAMWVAVKALKGNANEAKISHL